VIIGGHDYEMPEFLQLLPAELRDRVAGTFSIDPVTAPQAEIRNSASAILERYEREQEQRLVSEVLEKAAMGQPTALGLESCLQADHLAAINTLLVQEGATAPGVVCDDSRWLAPSGDTCPLCGKPTRRTPDVIDELVVTVIDEGGSTRHIEAGTKLSEYLVAADLRFPLPPAPTISQ
jgi:peptide chain release factor subunit 1